MNYHPHKWIVFFHLDVLAPLTWFPSELIWKYGSYKQSVELLRQGISPVAMSLPTQDNTNTGETRTDMHVSNGIRTHDPSIWAGDNIWSQSCVEEGSNTSTVALRVVGGDEKGSLESETVKYWSESHGTRTRKWLRCRGPAAIANDRTVLSSERAPHINKPTTVRQ
jgi:hypothetical protein